mmetsp:Transcript_69912/g.138534  ORF Transcript_69912/g.138534 Transcript_69912/m.138534 type:complete len:326 (-) Transcript_69912:1180-2157(-)
MSRSRASGCRLALRPVDSGMATPRSSRRSARSTKTFISRSRPRSSLARSWGLPGRMLYNSQRTSPGASSLVPPSRDSSRLLRPRLSVRRAIQNRPAPSNTSPTRSRRAPARAWRSDSVIAPLPRSTNCTCLKTLMRKHRRRRPSTAALPSRACSRRSSRPAQRPRYLMRSSTRSPTAAVVARCKWPALPLELTRSGTQSTATFICSTSSKNRLAPRRRCWRWTAATARRRWSSACLAARSGCFIDPRSHSTTRTTMRHATCMPMRTRWSLTRGWHLRTRTAHASRRRSPPSTRRTSRPSTTSSGCTISTPKCGAALARSCADTTT